MPRVKLTATEWDIVLDCISLASSYVPWYPGYDDIISQINDQLDRQEH